MAHYSSQVFSPLITVWTSPKRTMQQIMERGGDYKSNWLFFAAGTSLVLIDEPSEVIGYWSVYVVLLGAMLIGGLSGILIFNILATIIERTSKWFGGNGRFIQTRNALAWALFPAILTIPLFILKFIVFGKAMTIENPEGPMQNVISLAIYISRFITWFWAILLLTYTLHATQGYTRLLAFLHQLTALTIFILPFWGIAMLF